MENVLLLVEAFTAIFFIGLSVPLIRGKVRPNSWYGVRVRKTLADEDLWYKANAYFGRDMLIACLAVLMGCVVMFFIKDGMTLNTFLTVVSTVLMLPYAVAVIRTFLYLRRA